MTPAPIEFERAGNVAVLRLNRPQVANALDRGLVAALARHLDAIADDDALRAVVLCGAGRGFCAGADLRELAACTPAEATELELAFAGVFDRLAALDRPTIAAIHGYAVGGGFFLSLYCDLRIVATGTQLGFPEAAQQWLPPWALSRLAAWVGPARAEQLVLVAGRFDAAQGATWGLVDQLVAPDELLPRALEVARRVASAKPPVVAEARRFFGQLRGQPHDVWDRISATAFARGFASPTAQAALDSFNKPQS
ncbi:MAG: enoyl-CoA hydratase/isomerase family protein [Pirellulales bacterium]|nr:enoyl-CoA hydratase/isomerase family protein [Pirellulales bacterium]